MEYMLSQRMTSILGALTLNNAQTGEYCSIPLSEGI
jgi:hypothetical protein